MRWRQQQQPLSAQHPPETELNYCISWNFVGKKIHTVGLNVTKGKTCCRAARKSMFTKSHAKLSPMATGTKVTCQEEEEEGEDVVKHDQDDVRPSSHFLIVIAALCDFLVCFPAHMRASNQSCANDASPKCYMGPSRSWGEEEDSLPHPTAALTRDEEIGVPLPRRVPAQLPP